MNIGYAEAMLHLRTEVVHSLKLAVEHGSFADVVALATLREHLNAFAKASPSVITQEELRALRGGQFIEAIRLYRARTGAGLADSKKMMETQRELLGIGANP